MPLSFPSRRKDLYIASIFIDEERREVDEEHVEYLAENIHSEGLVHPPTVLFLPPNRHPDIRSYYKVPDSFEYILIAGAHRCAAFTLMGETKIPALVIDDPKEWKPSTKMALEFIENQARKSLSWQESVIAIARTHKQYQYDFGKENRKWAAINTGKLLGISRATVFNTMRVAKFLEDKKCLIWECKSLTEAYTWIMREAANAARKELNARHRATKEKVVKPEVIAEERAKGISVEQYKEQIGTKREIIEVSPALDLGCFHEDALQTMARFESEKFHAIITDPMYGLDKSRISSRSTGFYEKFAKLQTGPAAAEIEEFVEALPEFYRILRPNSWFIFFYDLDYHEQLQRAVTLAGFTVQRWPLIWQKLHANKNEAAKYNTTKNYEVAMVCRKGKAVLDKPVSHSIFSASREDCSFVKSNKDHPFVKPYSVWHWLFDQRVHPGDLVYEPYAGRGSMCYYAARNDINFFCSERVEEHYIYLEHNIRQWKTGAESLLTSGETITE